MKNNVSPKGKGILCLITVSFFAVYLALSFSYNIWTDEAFTVELLQRDIPGIIHGTAVDVHPPLYYLIAKLLTYVFGSSRIVLKMVSVIPMIIMMYFGGIYVSKLMSERSGVIFSITLGLIPCVAEYAVQLRMYSWAMCFITFMALSAADYYINETGSSFIMMIVCGIGAAYCHYFAFASAILIYGFLFLAAVFFKKKILFKWLVAVVLSLLAYLPWLSVLASQLGSVSSDYWIEEITLKTVKGFFPFLFGMDIPGSTLVWIVILIVSVLAVVRFGNIKTIETDAFCILCLLVPVFTAVTGIVASKLIRPVFIIRYVVPCMGLIAILIAHGLDRVLPEYKEKRGKQACFIAGLFAALCFLIMIKNAWKLEYTWCKSYETKAFFETNLSEGDIIAYNYSPYNFVYCCYWDKDMLVDWQELDLEKADYDNIWFLDTLYWPEADEEDLAKLGYKSQYMGNYGVEHNDFKIYRIYKE